MLLVQLEDGRREGLQMTGHRSAYTCGLDRLDHLVIALDIASHDAVECGTHVARATGALVARQYVSKIQVACVHIGRSSV